MESYNYVDSLGLKDVRDSAGCVSWKIEVCRRCPRSVVSATHLVPGGFRGKLQWEPGNKPPKGKIALTALSCLGGAWEGVSSDSPAQRF